MSLEQSRQVVGNELIPLMEMGTPQSAVCVQCVWGTSALSPVCGCSPAAETELSGGLGVTPEQGFQSCTQRGKFLYVTDGVRSGPVAVEGGWLVTGLPEQSLSLSSFLSVVSTV